MTRVSQLLRSRSAILICIILIAVFALLAWFASAGKSATMDEPLHAVGGYVSAFEHDFRINPEDPPLWKYWAMLPQPREALKPDYSESAYAEGLASTERAPTFCVNTLYRTRDVDGAAFIDRSREMMIGIGMLLAATLAAWAWQRAGPIAALTASVLFCLDPNFLAHAALVKNDVAMTLAMLAMVFAAWRVGRHATILNIALAALACGAGLCTKFSGVILPLMLAMLMFARALLAAPWPCAGRVVSARVRKLVVASVITVVACVVSALMIWACYGFRFDPTATPHASFDFKPLAEQSANQAEYLRSGEMPPAEKAAILPLPAFTRAVGFANAHRILPQAWLYGLLHTYQASQVREAFLLGRLRDTGWWYYFPIAMLVKTPLTTLIALLAVAVATLITLRRRVADVRADLWPALCVAIPLLLYGAFAITSHLNLGLRHVLPIYPFLFLIIAVSVSRAAAAKPRATAAGAMLLAGLLAGETLAAYPNYIPFFNAAAGGPRGGLRILGDSNLDWGQDLPLLADWQAKHPTQRLYFCYFGSADPSFYGIRYINLPSGYFLNPTAQLPDSPGIIAVSATKLQGIHVYPEVLGFYDALRAQHPREVLGGTIYLYDYPSSPPPLPSRSPSPFSPAP